MAIKFQILSPANTTYDLAIGGSATGSSLFQVLGTDVTTGSLVTATSSAITTGNLFNLGEGGNQNFSGNAILADLGNSGAGGGGFTGNFLKFNNAGTTKYYIDSAGNASQSGNLTLGNGSAIQSAYGPLTLNYKSGANAWTPGLTLTDTTGNATFAQNLAVNGGNLTTNQTTANLFTNATTLGIGASSGTTTINNSTLALAGNISLPNSNTLTGISNYTELNNGVSVGGGTTYYFDKNGNINAHNLNVTNTVGSNLTPSATDTYNLGSSSSIEWNNIYGKALYQSGNTVCDSSNNCGYASGGSDYWGLSSGALYPLNNSVDFLIGADSTSSAKFAFTGVSSGTPTASISGSTANVATYLTGNGTLSTTNAQGLVLGSSTTGNVTVNSRGSNALVANGANLTAGGTVTLPNSNTATGLLGYLELSQGVSVGNGTVYYFDQNGNISANAGTFGGTVSLPNSNILTGVSNFVESANGYSVGGGAAYYFDKTGNINANAGTFAGNVNANSGSITTNQTTANLLTSNATTINLGLNGSGSVNIGGGSGSNGCSFNDATGSITCAGNITTTATSGTQGWWQLNGPVLSPANSSYDLAVGGSATGSAFQVFGSENATSGLESLNSTVTTTGNVFNATSSAITSGNMISLGNGGASNFTGNGIFENFGVGGGSSFTGNFLMFNNANSTKFEVDASGNVKSASGTSWMPLADSSTALGIANAAGSRFVDFDTTNLKVGIGTASPLSTLSVVGTSANATGKAALLVDQYQNQDILTASASGATRMSLASDGTLSLYNATSLISNTAGDISLSANSGNISFSSDNITNVGTLNAGTGIFSGILQAGYSTAATYSRFGNTASTHGLSASQDVLIGGNEELNGVLYLNNSTAIANSFGTATVLLSSAPSTTSNILAAGNWLIDNTANAGQAALMVSQEKAGPLFTASASGVPKFTINNDGSFTMAGSSSAPTVPTSTGSVYYNTATNQLFYNNSKGWVSLDPTQANANSLQALYHSLAAAYTPVGYANQYSEYSAIASGISFDNFSDTTKTDVANTTATGPVQISAPNPTAVPPPSAPYRVGLMGGDTMSNGTTDSAGNTYLGSSNVKKTVFYDRNTDSAPLVQVQLGIDPNWYNGVTLAVATTSAQLSQNDVIASGAKQSNPNLTTSYNGSLIKATGNYASNAQTIYITIATSSTFNWTDYNGNSGSAVSMTPGTAVALGGTGVSVTFTSTNYNIGDVFKIASWFVEPSGSTRGAKAQFPERSYVDATATDVEIIDADTQKLWMKFATGTNLMLATSTNDVPNSVSSLNGELYVAKNGSSATGLYTLDFVHDAGFRRNATDYRLFSGLSLLEILQPAIT